MPHLRLEYTNNIKIVQFSEIFNDLINVLIENTSIKASNCKSRAIKVNELHMDCSNKNGKFVHLEIAMLEGRSKQVKHIIIEQSLKVLETYFNNYQPKELPQISLEIREMKQTNYFTTNIL